MKTKIRNSISGLVLIPLVLAGFALLPRAQAETQAQAVTPQLALPGFNTADGFNALDSLTTGTFNSAFGALTLEDNTTGSHNTALGGQALRNNNGSFNTAVGEIALVFNTTGGQNMALGQGALASNTTGSNNVAMGFQALNANQVTSGNVGVGFQALRVNTGGTDNVAVGFQALVSNQSGTDNTATGSLALVSNTTGDSNAAYGAAALADNIGGNGNAAFGFAALESNTSGGFNTAVGTQAGGNITGTLNIDIGTSVLGVAGENTTTRIGLATGASKQTACFIGGIAGVTPTGGTQTVIINANGQLGSVASSRRFKTDIKPMDKTSDAILALKPVTFHYKNDTATPQFGLIAEEVAQVNPDLIVRDEKGEIYSVRYEAVNAMLLNEFLKEHKKVEELKNDFQATVARQQKEIQALTAQLKEQAAQIQKVSAQIEMSRPAPQIAVSDQ